MEKVMVNKAAPIDAAKKIGVCKSVTIVIDKEWKGPDPTGLTNELFFKALDREFNDQAMSIANALKNSLPGGTWDRLVGIMSRMHASYIIVNHDELEKKKERGLL